MYVVEAGATKKSELIAEGCGCEVNRCMCLFDGCCSDFLRNMCVYIAMSRISSRGPLLVAFAPESEVRNRPTSIILDTVKLRVQPRGEDKRDSSELVNGSQGCQ